MNQLAEHLERGQLGDKDGKGRSLVRLREDSGLLAG